MLVAARELIETFPDETAPPTAAFTLPEDGPLDPRPILAHLVRELHEFIHLRAGEATIMVVFRTEPKSRLKRRILAQIALPRFQGTLGPFAEWMLAMTCGGTCPDFLVILDAEFWRDATDKQREALLYHELCHAIHDTDKDGELKFDDDGRPVFGLVGHDLEEFGAVVRRYGAWLDDVADFAAALAEGGVL